MINSKSFKYILALILWAGTLYASATEVKLLSAVVKGKSIDNANIIWQRAGNSSVKTVTDGNGKTQFSQFPDDNQTTMIIEKTGYSTLVLNCPCDGFTYALSPEMVNLDGMRVVLTWGAYPKDLDSHLVYPNNHVYYSHKSGTNSNLDVDDRSGYGPETITLTKRHIGERYVYAVKDYSNRGDLQSRSLSRSNARVDVYVGKTHIRTYKVKSGITANHWVVFGVDGDGAFHDINQYVSLPPYSTDSLLNDIIKADGFESHQVITDLAKKQAKRQNTQGERLYADKQYTPAMYAFQDAINLDPNFSQAYSNLGVTFPKLGRDAEALWANRKAIDLASGSRANRVKASSYYNIAKIYEKSGQWQLALNNYETALSFREHSAYHKGIKRMQANLR